MTLVEYFEKVDAGLTFPSPQTGIQTDWLDFCELNLKGRHFLIGDASFAPEAENGLLVELPPGNYRLQAKVINFGGDRRPARLRVLLARVVANLGEKIGETSTDTACTGIRDFETYSAAWGNDDKVAFKLIQPDLEDGYNYGIAKLDAARGIVMPFIHSGFGDGSYPVFELLNAGRRVGFEVEFIPGGKRYTFGETPYERNIRIQALHQQAESGDTEIQWRLGQLYRKGEGVERNIETAAHWFAQAAKNGHLQAIHTLGLMYQKGQGVIQDYGRARALYERAADQGLPAAFNQLGVLYRHGYGVPVDLEKSTDYFLEAAQKGSPAGHFNLGVHHANGLGVTQSDAEAVKWFRSAAERGYPDAMFNLGICLSQGRGLPQDEAEAYKWFLTGANAGHATCCYNVAVCFRTGKGVEKKVLLSTNWYTKAALQGLVVAQRDLGMLYLRGEDKVPRQMDKALKWLREAVKNGDMESHYELGLIHETGDGTPENKLEAVRLYKLAAAQGHVAAKERLTNLIPKLTDAERALC